MNSTKTNQDRKTVDGFGERNKYTRKEKEESLEVVEAREREEIARILSLGKRRESLAKLRFDPEFRVSASAPTSPNVSTLELTWDEDKERSIKRKKVSMELMVGDDDAEILSANIRLANSFRRILGDVDEDVRKLAESAKERNTKREIKEICGRLRSQMSLLTSATKRQLLMKLGRETGRGTEELVGVKVTKDLLRSRKCI